MGKMNTIAATLIKTVRQAWNMRDQNKTNDENIGRMANAFSMSEEDIRTIVK